MPINMPSSPSQIFLSASRFGLSRAPLKISICTKPILNSLKFFELASSCNFEKGRWLTFETINKGEWFLFREMMEVNGRTLHSHEKRPLENPRPSDMQKKAADNITNNPVFVNHAAIAWNESRNKWIGNVSQRLGKTSKDPLISWSTTYEDLLSTHDPFSEPIPLSEMVDFLVDIWQDEGLFD